MRSAAMDMDSTTTCNRRIKLQQVPNSSTEESNYLPFDVVIGILSRLPVKTLFRLKSLCKIWDAMIPTNPDLVSLHLKNYTHNPATKASLVCNYDHEDDRWFSANPRWVSLCPDAQRPIQLDQSLLQRVICGTGHGLFLLGNRGALHPDYRLWNPATRKTRHLPDPPLAPPYLTHSSDHCGVGIDQVANDIKVVLIRNYVYTDAASLYAFRSPVFLYTLRSNCWRELEESCPYWEGQNLVTCHTYFKGFFYWLVEQNEYVVAFDMGSDVFHRIECPLRGNSIGSLSIYGDSIALFRGPLFGSSVAVWLLSESGGQWCWIKQSNLGPVLERSYVKRCWKNGQFICHQFRPNNKLVLFEIGAQECKVLIPNCWHLNYCYIYKESLVSIT
ncbi:unnamed protein product [Linum tenue]|uniref:F-box domain-containing protein n=1 Tax=Linum tenue TaxID=586396 RepID=A0AAV0HY14_9ROSI|nr:unnamed protein product [Linum tenue]